MNTPKYRQLSDEGAKSLDMFILLYANGYCTRKSILQLVDTMLRNEYIKGETNGLAIAKGKLEALNIVGEEDGQTD